MSETIIPEGFDPTLSKLQAINAAFDAENDTAATLYNDPELHIGFHIVNTAKKLLYDVKEKSDHSGTQPDDKIIDDEIIPDLLKYAVQLAEIRGKKIGELYLKRLASLEIRNNTPGSAERAINILKET